MTAISLPSPKSGAQLRRRGPLVFLSGMVRYHLFGAIGAVFIIVLVAVALLAPFISPYDPNYQDFNAALTGPSAAHWFGVDNLGRDVLSRVIWGSIVTAQVTLAVPLAIAVGVPFGLIAGAQGGKVDTVIMRVVDALMTIPSIFLAISLLVAFGASIVNVVVALAVANLPRFARLARSRAIAITNYEYITAATAIGLPRWRIILQHIAPNAIDPIIVQGSLLIGSAVLLEAGLSFLGLGVPPPTPTWGSLIKTGYQFLSQAPWIAIASGMTIFVAVLSFNLFGDMVRDYLDPRMRHD